MNVGISFKQTMVALGCAVSLAGGSAVAAPVTLTGTTVIYQFDDTALGQFGPAFSLVGDSLVFTPANFAVSTTSILPAVISTINLSVTARSGLQLSSFSLLESGSYSQTGGGLAYVTGNLEALDIEGNTGNHLVGSIQPTYGNGSWTALANVALPATGWGGADGIVGSASLMLSNQLFAVSNGGFASINKNSVSVTAFTMPVPEVNSYAMMLAGLGMIGFLAGRRGRVVG